MPPTNRQKRNRRERRQERRRDDNKKKSGAMSSALRGSSRGRSGGGGGYPDFTSGGSGFRFSSPNIDPAYEAQKAQYNAEEHALKANAADNKAALDAIYGGTQAQMAPLAGQFANQSNQIANQFTTQLQGFAPAFGLGSGFGTTGGGDPQGGGYANQYMGSIGASTLGLLANDAQRTAGYGNMSKQQGAIEQMEAGRGAQHDLQNSLTELSMARAGLRPDLADRELQAWEANQRAREFDAEQRRLAYEAAQERRDQNAYNDVLAKMLAAKRKKKKPKPEPEREDDRRGPKQPTAHDRRVKQMEEADAKYARQLKNGDSPWGSTTAAAPKSKTIGSTVSPVTGKKYDTEALLNSAMAKFGGDEKKIGEFLKARGVKNWAYLARFATSGGRPSLADALTRPKGVSLGSIGSTIGKYFGGS